MTNWTSNKSKGRKNNQPNLTKGKNIFIRELRGRVDAYFKFIVRNLKYAIPKALGY